MIATGSVLKAGIVVLAGIAVFLTDYALRDPSPDGGIAETIRNRSGWRDEARIESVAPLAAVAAIIGAVVAGIDGLLVVLAVGAAVNLAVYTLRARATS